jgi:hypothetical protein
MTEPQQPSTIPHAKKMEIQNALQSRIRAGCPRCNGNAGTLADGYTYHPLQNGDPTAGVQAIYGTIVCAVIICNTCGYLTEYSLPHLGVTPFP